MDQETSTQQKDPLPPPSFSVSHSRGNTDDEEKAAPDDDVEELLLRRPRRDCKCFLSVLGGDRDGYAVVCRHLRTRRQMCLTKEAKEYLDSEDKVLGWETHWQILVLYILRTSTQSTTRYTLAGLEISPKSSVSVSVSVNWVISSALIVQKVNDYW